MRGKMRRSWVKFHITGWLHGSIRWQLTPEERSVWADLICLAGECGKGGSICDNDDRPYPLDFVANQLNIPRELLDSTILQCKQEGRIDDKDGVIIISNWETYQSEYDRQKVYRVAAKKKGLPLEQYKAQLREEFSDIDFEEETKKFELWWGDGNRELKRPKLALRNWMVKARKFKEEGKDGANRQTTGKLPKRYTQPDELRY